MTLASPLTISVELYLGGVWTDVSTYVYYRDQIKITRGRQEEGAQVDPGKCNLTFDNRDGRFSPRNPTGPYYGLLKRNTPISVDVVDGGTRYDRFCGEVAAWPIRWEDKFDVYVPIEAAGVMRRLGQSADLKSALFRKVTQAANLLAYWSLEDGENTTVAGSGIPNGKPLSTSGLEFGADTSLSSSGALPTIDAAATLRGSVVKYTPGGWGNTFEVDMVFKLAAVPPTTSEPILQFLATGGLVESWSVQLLDDQVVVVGRDEDNVVVWNDGYSVALSDHLGEWLRLRLVVHRTAFNETGYDVTIVSATNGQLVTGAPVDTFGAAGAVSLVSTKFGATFTGSTVGHVAVFADDVDVYDGAFEGYAPEEAGDRVIRLGGEENVTVVTDGEVSEVMGPQGAGTLLGLLRECQDADGGVLFETRDQIGLQFKSHTFLTNQGVAATLNYTATGELQPPLDPTEDDQNTNNDVTVARRNGSSARVADEDGSLGSDAIGVYSSSTTVNVYDDGQLPDLAGWRLHLGTVDEARFPQIVVDFTHLISVGKAALAATLALVEVGDRIQITNPPAWLPPETIDQLVQGYSETLDQVSWQIAFVGSPASAWTVGVYSSVLTEDLAKYSSDGTTVNTAMNSSVTTMSAATPSGSLWTTASAQYPFDLMVGGERMTATACSGSSSPQTFTVTRSVNGVVKSHAVGEVIELFTPAHYGY